MLNKKDNHDIFRQYKQVLLEQVEDSGIFSLINRVKSSTLDPKTKGELLSLLDKDEVKRTYSMMIAQKEHGIGDMDAAGYSDQDEESGSLGKFDYRTGCYEKETEEACELRKSKHKTAIGSFASL